MKKFILTKGMIIALSVIVISLLGIILYNSYAINTGLSLGNDDNTYDILLNESSNTVTVPAKSSKTVYYQFSNTNKGTIKYHIGYTSDNCTVKVWWDTEDFISGTIDYGEYKFIKLKLINETSNDDTITLKPILGFKDGGDLVVPNDTTLVTGTINKVNTMSVTPSDALSTLGIAKTSVDEISFVEDNLVPSNALGSTTVSSDNSIMLWYTASNTDDMYKIYIGSDNGITSFPANSSSLFSEFVKAKVINLDNIDTSKVTNMSFMFYKCNSLTLLNLSNFDTSLVIDMNSMFSDCKQLINLDISSFNTSKVTNMSSMFNHCRELMNLDVSNFDTSLVTEMVYMFNQCRNISYLDVSKFNTSLVTDMSNMFYGCQKLEIIDISGFNTTKVKNMKDMFRLCSNLIYLDLSSFDTSLVTDMSGMFYDCKKVVNLDVSGFNTLNVNNMSFMFYGCNQLRSIEFSNAQIPNVTDVSSMFSGDVNLTTIDMRNADLSNVTSYDDVLNSVPTTVNIYLKDTQSNRDFMSNNYSSYTNVQYIFN